MKKFIVLLPLWLAVATSHAAEPLATLDYKISGQVMQVTPASLAVPKGIPGSVATSIPGAIPSGSYVEAFLRGPSFPARRLVGAPNVPLLLPPLNLAGDYSLDGIRLAAADGTTLLDGSPASVPVHVFDEVLVSRVTSRPLSLSEIEDRGIEIDDLTFRAVEFEVGFVVDGKSFPVKFPVIAPSFKQTTEIIPAAELEERVLQAEMLNQQLSETVSLPPELETVMPQFQVKGINMEFGSGEEEDELALSIPPIPALMVIPGNIGFLNQFFSVRIYTENAAPTNSGLSVHSLTAELLLPPGPDQAAGTFENPGDDPLRFARVNGAIQNIVPVRATGPDGQAGTGDDINRLQPGDSGEGELLVEGLQEGLHVMNLRLKAKLDGLAAGTVEVTGKAAGSILVRNPKFSMAFTHPRTVRFGEPYEALVTILNTSATTANLVSVELNANNVSGGKLDSATRVELGTIAPGETKSATFRIISQKTGAITFSNLTTSDDSVIGRFRLKAGVDERGVALSPDSLTMPEFLELLPRGVVNAAQRVLGQALSTNTAGQLPPGVLRVSKRLLSATTAVDPVTEKVTRSAGGSMLMALLEAAQRVRFDEPLGRVLPDLLLDWQGARDFDPGWDQLIRETDAGREWREALMLAMEQEVAGPDHAVARLVARNRDFAGRGEAWLVAASDRGTIDLSYRDAAGKTVDFARSAVAKSAGYGGADGDWLVAAEAGTFIWKMAAPLTGEGQFNLSRIRADGTARELLWRVADLPAGACVSYDATGSNELLEIDANCDGTAERTVAAQGTDFSELPPEVLLVRQDPEVHVARPSKPCPNPTTTNDLGKTVPIKNYANIVAVLFSKPMTQATADVPAAYRLENGNEAAYVQMQSGGRIALLTMKAPLGGKIKRSMTVAADVKDVRGNPLVVAATPVETRLTEGVNVRGRVIRADGTFAANVPVTLTYNDSVDGGLSGDCVDWIRRVAQVRTDATGAFDFDFVIGGIPYSLSATDTSGLSDEAIELILGTAAYGAVDAAKLEALAALPQNADTLLSEFAAGAMPEAIAKAEGLDRATIEDLAVPGRFRSESVYALRFRGRGTVTGQVLLADGQTPVAGAAANLFPDVNSRELGRGILTDGAGRFAFFGVPLGPFTIEATTPTGLTRTVSGLLSATGETVNMVVSVGATPPTYSNWQGRVVEPDGTPVPNGPVYVGNHLPGGGFLVNGRTVADANGYWSIPQIPVGSYVALAFSLDGMRKGTRGPLVSVANVTTTANIVLQARATVEGVVQFANGDPVAGAVVGGGIELARTDALGRFTLNGVPTGQGRTISAGIAGDESSSDPRKHLTRMASVSIDVQAGDNFAVIRFESQGRIVGQLLDDAGVPVPNEKVALPFPFGDEPFFLWVQSDANGFYEFPGLSLKGPIGGAYDVSSPSPVVAEKFDGEAAANQLVGASSEQVAAILGKAFTAFTGVNDPLLTGGAKFNPVKWGFLKGVRLDFDGETEVANIRFSRKSVISGIVKNGQGVPIGARVRLTGIGPNGVGYPTFVTRAEKNSDPALGIFEFNGDAFVGDWGLQAASPFFPTVIATSGRTTSLEPNATGIVLQFPPVKEINGSLTGQILLADGSPAGANVEVRVAVGGDDPRILRTDAEGRFTTGAALFSLRGNTGYQITVFDPATGGVAQDSIFVKAAQDNPITLTLLGRGTAEIFVKKADGTPAAGAAVEIQGGRYPYERATGVADSQGRIAFANLFQGPYAVNASATIGLSRVAGRAGLVVPLDGTATATVTLAATATVTGTFVTTDGVTPIGFANVRLGSFAYAPTDANGRFSFVDVPLGSHVLTAVDQVTGRGGNTTVSLTQTNEIRDVRIVETSLGTISGLILNAQGTGTVPNAEVSLTVDDAFALTRSFRVTSGPDGAYSIAGVAVGSFTITAVGRLPDGKPSGDSGMVRTTLPAGVSSLTVDIPFEPRAGIVARVVEADGTTPAASVAVQLFMNSSLIRTLDADPQGQVTFGNLELGNYGLIAISRVPGQTRSRSTPAFVTLNDRGQEAQASMTMRGTASVQGMVFQADGTTPAGGAEVKLEVKPASYPYFGGRINDPAAGFTESVAVASDGAFEFTNLPSGLPVVLSAKLLGLAAAETIGSIAVGETATRNLLLTASGTVAGRILREDGSTVAAGTDVVVEFPSRSGLQGTILQIVGPDGRFSLAPVPQGNWSVKATDSVHGGLAFRSGDIAVNNETDELGDIVLDESFPAVTSTIPADTTEGVDIHTVIDVFFSEPLDPGTVNPTGVFVRPASGGAAVPATLTQPSPSRLRIAPTAPLASETTYQIVAVDGDLRNAVNVITNRGPRDRVGRSLLALFTASFTTRDQRPPEVLSFTPAGGSNQVDPRTPLRLTFDEPIQPGATFTLTGPGGTIPGTTALGVNNLVLTFVPTSVLPVNAVLTASVEGVRDLAGNLALNQPLSSTFATLDTQGPVIAELRIKNGAAPSAGAAIVLEAVLATPEPGVSYRLSANAITVATSAVGVLEVPFTLPTSGTVIFRGIATDSFGNEGPLAELPVTVVPNSPPVIALSRLNPLTGAVATGSPVSVRLSVTDDSGITDFKAAMTGAATAALRTTTGADITLSGVVKTTAGPADVITLVTQATDTSGVGTGEKTFTIPIKDGTSPTLALDGAIPTRGFAPGETVSIPVRGRDNFGVTRYTLVASGAVTGNAEFLLTPAAQDDPRVLTFVMPSETPVTGAAFALTLRAEDAAGLISAPLLVNLQTADQTPPQIAAFSPPNNASNQSTRPVLSLTFSEALDRSSVDPESVKLLRQTDETQLPATVTLNGAGRVATLTPTTLPLDTAASYRIVATTALKDPAGNPLAAEASSVFTTASFAIAAPLANAQVVEGQPLAVSISETFGLAAPREVRFFVGDLQVAADSDPPFAATISVPLLATIPAGTLPLRAELFAGARLATATVNVSVHGAADDSDGDGIPNDDEIAAGSDPFRNDADADPDGDGLTNSQEVAAGTKANDADSDDDFLNDGAELAATTDPLDPDTDDDLLIDGRESLFGANPKLADTDGDSLTDGFEVGFGRITTVSGNFTWLEALADAESRGGHLLTLTSAKENSGLLLVNPNIGSTGFWLGFTDRFLEGQFRWVTGETSSFTNFASSQPDNFNNEDFIHFFTADAKWNDHNASHRTGYILETGFFTDPTLPDTDGDGLRDDVDDFVGTPNLAPLAADDSFFRNAGETIALSISADLLGNDSDPNGDPFAFLSFTQPSAGGTVSQPNAGTLVLTPDAGFSGLASFSYTILDAGGLTKSATVGVTIGTNTRPVADPEQHTTPLNTPLLVRLDGSDVDNHPLTATVRTLPAHGRLFQFAAGAAGTEITAAGTPVTDSQRRLVYLPNADFTGLDGFDFSVSDFGLESLSARLTIAVVGSLAALADDVWDASAGAVVTANSPMAAPAVGAFDGTTVAATFADGQSAGFVHFIEWETPTTVLITAAKLAATDDGPASAARGFSELRLFGRMADTESFTLLATYRPAANPYFGELRAEVAVASFVGTQFRAEFDAAVVGSGPNLTELDAVGEPVAIKLVSGPVKLQNATATGSQGGFSAAGTIDGNTNGSNGWALGGNLAQTIVWETVNDISATADKVFAFNLIQNFDASHHMGRFRLSATTDDRSVFADGLVNGGDVTANWTVLEVVSFAATGGPLGTVLSDQSILVSGPQPNGTTYTVRVKGIVGKVTGFRLELMKDGALPSGGPGRASNGNMVLNEVTVAEEGVVSFNRAPQGKPDTLATIQGIPVALAALANDTDPENDPLTIKDFEQPPSGQGTVTADGQTALRYDPGSSFVGTTSFTYRPTDGLQNGAPTLVTVTVRPTFERRWINPAGGNWSNPANWLSGVIPGPDDIAVIDPPGTYQVNIDQNVVVSQLRLGVDAGMQTLSINSNRSLTVLNGGTGGLGGRLLLNAGTLSADGGNLVVARLDQGGGNLAGAGNVTVNGAFNWSSGVIFPGGKLILAAGSANSMTGGSQKWMDRVVENSGTLTYSGGEWRFNLGSNANGRLENLAGGTLIFDSDGDISHWNGGSNSIRNSGLIIRRGAGATTINGAALVNLADGTVRIEAGTLDLPVGTTLAGRWERPGGSLNLRDASFTIPSSAIFEPSQLTANNARLNFSGDRIMEGLSLNGSSLDGVGNVTVTGTFHWSGGQLSPGGKLILAAGCTGTMTGGSQKWMDRVVENSGTLTYSGGEWRFNLGGNANGRFENLAGGTLIFDGDGDISHWNGGTNSISNAGLVIRRGGGTTTINSLPFQNLAGGTTRLETGTLDLPISATLAGNWERTGGSLNLRDATFTIPSSAVFTPSQLTANNARMSFSGDRIIESLSLNGSSLDGAGNVTVTGTFHWSGGQLSPGGKLILAAGCTGSMTGGSQKWMDRVVENSGALTYSGAEWRFNLGSNANGRLDNLAGGTLIFDGDGDLSHWNGGTNSINNAGLVIRRGAGATTINSLPFQNLAGGTTRIEAGTLDLPVSSTLAGNWERTGGSLNLRDAVFTIPSSAVFEPNQLAANNARLNISGDRTFEGLSLNGSSLDGAGNVTVTGTFNWSGGQLSPGGKLILAAGCTGSMTGGAQKWMDRVVENSGTLTYSGGEWRFNLGSNANGRLENLAGGTLIFDGDGDLGHWNGGTNSINNAGLVIRRGAGTTTINSLPLVNLTSGTVRLEAGTLQPISGFTQSGILAGKGSLAASFTNNGIIRPAPLPGIGLTVSGNLTQGAAGRIELTLAERDATLGHRSLTVTGSAALGGTLAVTLQPPFAEDLNAAFDVVRYGSRSSDFTATEGLSANFGYEFTRAFTAAALQLTVTASGDVPSSGPPPELVLLATTASTYADWIDRVTQAWGTPNEPAIGADADGFTFNGAQPPIGWDHDPMADPDGDGSANLLEYALQTNPLDPKSCARLTLAPDAQQAGGLVAISRLRSEAKDIVCELEMSTDLVTWQPAAGAAAITTTSQIAAPGISEVVIRLNPALAKRTYLRWNVRLATTP